MKNRTRLKKTVVSAIFFALGIVLPFFTGQIPEIGSMLCPLHIPVLLCGFICGWPYGLAVGTALPLLRSLILGAPRFFPTAICMVFELATYGTAAGVMHKILPKAKGYIYCSLITAMLLGRIVWGLAMFTTLQIPGGSFTFSMFFVGAFANAIPGIIVQIIAIPLFLMATQNSKILNLKD